MARKLFKRLLGDLLVVGACAIVFVLAAEVALRHTSYRRYIITTSESVKGLFTPDPVSGFDMAPNLPPKTLDTTDVSYEVWSNELGCYDWPYNGEKDFILVIGDSQSQWYTPLKDKWVTVVERELGVRVVKCAVDGYGLKGEINKARKVMDKLPYPPKLVMLGYTVNEVRDDHVFPMMTVIDGYRVVIKRIEDETTGKVSIRDDLDRMRKEVATYEKLCSREPAVSAADYMKRRAACLLSRHSIFYNMAKDLVRKFFARVKAALQARGYITKTPDTAQQPSEPKHGTIGCNIWYTPPTRYPWISEAWDEQSGLFRKLNNMVKDRGSTLFAVMIVENEQVYSFFPRGAGCDIEIPNRMFRKICESQRIPHFDLLDDFRSYANQTPRPYLDPDKDFYWRYDGHWNIVGNRLAGYLVARHMLENGLVDVENRDERLQRIDKRLQSFNAKLN